MLKKIRHFRIPGPLIGEQKSNKITSDLYLVEIGEHVLPCGQIWKPERAPDYHQLIYFSRGKGSLTLNGSKIDIAGGNFCIIPADDSVLISSSPDAECHILTAGFAGIKADSLSSHFGIVRMVLPPVNNLVANRAMLFDELFNNLARGFHNENLEYIHFAFGHLLATFIYAHKKDDSEETYNQVMAQNISDYLNQNLHRKISLSQLAKVAGFSPTYFSSLFSKYTGYAPLSYFAHLKILKACELIDYTTMKIKDISFSLGYSDPYYFTRDFKKKMGISPRNYRKRITPKIPV
jgi:AraC family transcriptional regulator, arabinose operon regulatory protein